MKLENKSKHAYIAYDVVLEAGKVTEVKDQKALKILLKQPDVVEFASVEDTKALEDENKELKAKLEALESEKQNQPKTPAKKQVKRKRK